MNNIIVVGVNHTTAPLEMREKMALTSDKMKEVLAILYRYLGPNVVLSTCNRTEIYSVGEDPLKDSQKLVQFLSDYHHMPRGEFTSRIYAHIHEEAIRHLFHVTCGLDSMIFGEEQILAQVRRALEVAESNGTLKSPLAHVFRQALRVGKRARTETGISRYAVSISHACVELAQKVLGDLSTKKVLIISAGEMGELTGKIVRDSGATNIFVTNRTYERAVTLAKQLNGQAVPFSDLTTALVNTDMVVTATGAPNFILSRDSMAEVMKQRDGRPIILIDIAVPRDIDPETGKLENVCLYNIDDLQTCSQANLDERKREGLKVETIVDFEVARALRWWNNLRVKPTIIELRERSERVRMTELEKTLKKLPELTPEQQESLDAMTKAIIKKLLHNPTIFLKDEDRGYRYLPVLREFFGLEDGKN
ncbi:MAG: hemA [Dehalococcoidia bacterium]|nr:hemA [Dehalococcoidia bacterium]MBF8303732.1 hemA [Dehalococcoidia bacterium]